MDVIAVPSVTVLDREISTCKRARPHSSNDTVGDCVDLGQLDGHEVRAFVATASRSDIPPGVDELRLVSLLWELHLKRWQQILMTLRRQSWQERSADATNER